jgi:hypothetical protein
MEDSVSTVTTTPTRPITEYGARGWLDLRAPPVR